MKKPIALISAIFFLLISSALFTQSVAQGGLCHWNNTTANLNLTPEQIQEFGDLQQKYLEETASIRNEFNTKHLEFRALRAKPEATDNEIVKKQKEIFSLQTKLLEKSLAYRDKAKNILTSEQISLLPPGCSFGFALGAECDYGFGCRTSFGFSRQGYGCGRHGFGRGRGRCGW